MEDLAPFITQVAFYLSDGTTARKGLSVPLGQDDVVTVRKLIKVAKRDDVSIPVDSLDSEDRNVGEKHILPAHIVAFTISAF